MLKIYINNIEVVYDENISIQLELNSPVFTKKTAFTFPFKLPHSPNSEIFRSIDDLGNLYQKKGNDCVIEHGSFRIDGKVYIEDITDNYVKLNFRQEPVEKFMQELKDKYLNEIDYEESLPSRNYSTMIEFYDDPPDADGNHQYNFAMPPLNVTSKEALEYMEERGYSGYEEIIFNYRTKIYESENSDENFDTLHEYGDGYGGSSYRDQEEDYDSDSLVGVMCKGIMPFWRLKFVAKKVVESLNYTVGNDCISDDPHFNSMLVFSLHDLTFFWGVLGNTVTFKWLPTISYKDFFSRLEQDLNILTLFDHKNKKVSFLKKKDIIKSNDKEIWNYSYKIINSKPVEESNIKYTFDNISGEIKLAKDNGVFTDFETGIKNVERKTINPSVPSHRELDSNNSNNYYLQGWYTYETDKPSTLYKTVYAKYEMPHAHIKPNGPVIDDRGQRHDYIPESQPFRLLVYNYSYTNKERKDYVRNAVDENTIVGVNTYTGESYNYGHYRFYDNSESLDVDDANYTDLHQNFFEEILFWKSNLMREVELTIKIPNYKLTDFDFQKKRVIGSDKFLFRKIKLKLTKNLMEVNQVQAYTVP